MSDMALSRSSNAAVTGPRREPSFARLQFLIVGSVFEGQAGTARMGSRLNGKKRPRADIGTVRFRARSVIWRRLFSTDAKLVRLATDSGDADGGSC